MGLSVLDEAIQQAAYFTSQAKMVGGSGGMASPLGAVESSAAGQVSQTQLMHHAEQYRHFIGWPYSIIRIIAQRIAGQPIKIARLRTEASGKRSKSSYGRNEHFKRTLPSHLKAHTDELEVIEHHHFQKILSRPNPIMTQWALIYVTIASLEITGFSYWWWYYDEEEGRLQVWPLPSSWVEPLHEDDKLFTAWDIKPDGMASPMRVAANKITMFSYPDPSNPLGAVSPLQANARPVVIDESIQEAQRRSFSNGINPGLALIVGRHPDASGAPGEQMILTKAQREQLITVVKQRYRGVVNHDEPLILDGVIKDAKRITTAPRDMDYLNSSSLSKERLTQGWGVNPVSMGQLEGANRASSSAADDHYCLLGHTLVMTRSGYKPLSSIQVDDEVLTGDGQYDQVECLTISGYQGAMVNILAKGLTGNRCATPDHPFWIRRHIGYAWKRYYAKAKDIKPGDFLAMPQTFDYQKAYQDATGFPVASDSKPQSDGEYHWFEVQQVKETFHRGLVHNLKMRNIHSYVTEFGISSNCSNVINPKLTLISQKLSLAIQVLYNDPSLYAYIEEAHAVDPDYDLAVEIAMVDRAAMPRNEWRARHHLPPLKDGDSVFVGGAEIILPYASKKSMGNKSPTCYAKRLNTKDYKRLWLKMHKQAERAMATDLKEVFLDIARGVVQEIRAQAARGPISTAFVYQISSTGWMERVRDTVVDHVERICVIGASTEWELYVPRDRRTGDILTKALPPGLENMAMDLPQEVQSAVASYKEEVLKQPYWSDVVESVRVDIVTQVSRGIEDGESGDEIADRVGRAMGENGATLRSYRIARSESTSALNYGGAATRAKLINAGLLKGKRWLSIIDSDTRPDHKAANNQQVGGTDQFTVGGERCDHPGDLSLSASQRVNCRCATMSVTALDDDE